MSKSHFQATTGNTSRQNTLSRRKTAARAKMLAQCTGLEPLEDRMLLSGNTFYVTTNADNSDPHHLINGSLRWAIDQANANPGSTIDFSIASSGVQTLSVVAPLPALTASVTIDGTSEGAYAGSPLIVIDGSNAGFNADGLDLNAGNSTVKGLAIDNFGGSAISITGSGDIIEGNYLGTDSTGENAAGNGVGLSASSVSNLTVTANLISGNTGDGIYLFQVSGATLIGGNFIGTDETGLLALGNGGNGITIMSSTGLVVGGTTAANRNIISGNSGDGVHIDGGSGNTVSGNYIGTDATGSIITDANDNFLGNLGDGVNIQDSSYGNIIGGSAAGAGNVITGNIGDGVLVSTGSTTPLTNLIEGNYIGTDTTGQVALGNYGNGVEIDSAGGTITANVISANQGFGVYLNGSSTDVVGNWIGVDQAGDAMGNMADGVWITSSNNLIGGPARGQANIIANNGGNGVTVDSGIGNAIRANSIFSNSSLGIDLGDDGVTINDSQGHTSGPNLWQDYPLLSNAIISGSSITIGGTAYGAASTQLTLDLFANDPSLSGSVQGQTYLGQVTVTTNSSGQAAFSVSFTAPAIGSKITATATDPAGNTSEFSAAITSTHLTQSATTTTLGSSENPSNYGDSVTFTATVTGSGTPTGSVLFMDGTTVLGSGTLSNGVATFTTSSLTVGSHNITAVYSGDTDDTGSSSAPLTQSVSALATSTTITSSVDPSSFGQSVTFTATVTGTGSPTGSVLFMDGTTVLGSGTMVNGVATFTTSSLTVGSHNITAVYSGDTDDTGSSSAPLTQSVSALATSTTLTSSVDPSSFGQSVTFTATVTGAGSPTGSVLFMDGTTVLGSGTMVNGVATFTTSSLTVGSHNITAVYSGDTDDTGSSSAPLTQSVSALATSTTLTSSVDPSSFGQSVTFTATVTGAGSPTGSVLFMDGTTVLGSGTMVNGVATFTTSSLTVGSHNITAVYSGDTDDTGSSSAPLTQSVSALATNTTITSSVDPSSFGQSVTFTAAVTGAGSPTGSVLFMDGSTVLGSAPLINGIATLTTSALSVAAHNVTAQYSGDADSLPSGASMVQTVNPLATVTTLISSEDPANWGDSVTLTATVSSMLMPTGTVLFMDGTTVLGSATLVNGVATLTTSTLPIGTDSITAGYQGAADFAPSTSAPLSEIVNPLATITSLSSSVNPSNWGQSVTLSATVTGNGSPTGSVIFMDGSTVLGSGTLVNGLATLTVSNLSVGAHNITATYGGDADFTGSTSNPLAQTVKALATTTTLSSSVDPSNYGQSVTFTATVSGNGSPSGSVLFMDGTAVLGSATLVNGQATLTIANLGVGSHGITASYSGDSDFTGSASSPLVQNVLALATTTQLSSSLDPSSYGQSVTFTATVTGSGSPTGSVLFMDGSTVLGSATLINGVAKFTTSALAVGSHGISAAYGGDTDNLSSSANLSQTVNTLATTTTLASSLDPASYGQSVTFTATVAFSGMATGNVIFMDGSTVLGTGTLSNGVATFTTSALAVGSHTITAAYQGATNYATSISAPLTETINTLATTTTLSSSLNPANYGQSVTFTATVTSSGMPTGSVIFMDGSTVLGTGTLANGVATFTTSALAVGSHSITAAYQGATNYAASASAPLTETVNALATTTTLSSSLNPASYGQSVTLTATVASTGSPTGSVIFMDGSTILGSGSLSNGVATLTTSLLAVGNHTITAAYQGATNYATSASSPLTETIKALATTTSLSSSLNPAGYGLSVTFTASVTSTGTPTGTVTFMDGSSILGTGTLSGGLATFTTSALAVGSHSITAVYGGATNYTSSTSTPLTQTIKALATTTTVSSSANPSTSGQSVTFTATVTSTGTPTGTITFMDGSSILGTGTLSGGVATFTTSALSVGSHTITAVYGGATNYTASTSAPLTQIVNTASVTITGTTYEDLTGDGFSSDDLKLVGVTVNVYLDKNNDNTLDSGDGSPVATTVSGTNGQFSFASLPAGRYFVQEVVPNGYIQTAPYFPANYYTINAVGSTSYGSNNFDNFQKICYSATNIQYIIDNGCPVSTLSGNVQQGDTVKVIFTVPCGLTETFSLVSYTAPNPVFEAGDASQQQIYQDNYGTFGPGQHTLTVTIPKCYFQVDFVAGLAIDTFGVAGSNDFYSAQCRLISSCNGGTSPQLLFPPGSATIIKSS